MTNITIVKFLSCLILVLVLCTMIQQSWSIQKFCGKSLPEALDQICVNGFNSRIKKSSLGLDLGLDDYGYNEIEDDTSLTFAGSPFLSKLHGGSGAGGGGSLLAKTRRRRQGVYDECCRKGCSYSELFSYCL